MASTRLADVIVPEVFNPYVTERTAQLSALYQSGIVAPVAELEGATGEGGNTIQMPFWNDLSGDDEVLSATGGALTVNNIGSSSDVAVVFARGKAWGVNELAASLSGGDPMKAIGDLVAGYWARRMQAALVSTLKGVFGSASMAGNVHDISVDATAGNRVITAARFLDAVQRLGDAKTRLTAVAMHSAVETKLAQDNLIQYIRPSEGSPEVPTFQGKRVIVDDGLPNAAGVYNTYIFGAGAIGYANVRSSKLTETETDRDSLAGEDILINRRHFLLHPRGVKWASAATGGGPSNADLETGANFERVYENKNIRMVLLRHTIA